jgi:hypothetical protein
MDRMLSQEVEEGQNYPHNKAGKENCNDASKYRPISLLNVGKKVLEKLLINRIMHFIYSNELLNQNQFGFTPQRSTTDAAMAVKDFIEEALNGILQRWSASMSKAPSVQCGGQVF